MCPNQICQSIINCINHVRIELITVCGKLSQTRPAKVAALLHSLGIVKSAHRKGRNSGDPRQHKTQAGQTQGLDWIHGVVNPCAGNMHQNSLYVKNGLGGLIQSCQ